MSKSTWKERLQAAVTDSGKSMREISLGAKCSAGYLYDILKNTEKEPSLANLSAIVGQLDVSMSHILYGFELGADEEKLLEAYSQMNSDQRDAFLKMAASFAGDSTHK